MYKKIASSLLLFLLTACTSLALHEERKSVNNDTAEATKAMENARAEHEATAHKARVEYIDSAWMPVIKYEKAELDQFQSASLTRHIAFNEKFASIQQVAERLTFRSGIAIQLAPEVAKATSFAEDSTANKKNGTGDSLVKPTSGTMSLPMPGVNDVSSTSDSGSNWTVYDGSLKGFLDVIAARYNLSWEWNKKTIRLFKYKTETFKIVGLPGDTKLSSKVSNDTSSTTTSSSTSTTSTSVGTSGQSAQSVGIDLAKLSVWDAVESSIRVMLTQGDGKVAVASATGSVTVTDTPEVLSSVREYIKSLNDNLSKQIFVKVKVLSITLTDTKQYGINWDAVYKTANGKYGITLSNAFSTPDGSSSLSLQVLSGSNSTWAGSDAVVDALSEQGRVSLVTSAQVITMNNQPSPLQVGNQQTYLASSQTSTTTSTTSTSLTPGTINYGFQMTVLPNIVDESDIAMQFAINVSSLLDISTVTSGTATIQTPSMATRNFLQRVLMRSGDTLVMTGFESTNTTGTSNGIGSADFSMLGGSIDGERNKTLIAIILTPVILTLGGH